jgi:formate/nitrite transporter FocA (FNT family)
MKRSSLIRTRKRPSRTEQGLSAPAIYETIRREGEEELERPGLSLALSGLMAGIAIGFSVVGEAMLRAYLPDQPWRHLVESFGYTFGFVIIIMARLQLFTENTMSPVLPLLIAPSGARPGARSGCGALCWRPILRAV